MSTTERTDVDIQHEVASLFSSAALPLMASVQGGVVTLEGLVLSDQEREAASDLASFVAGVTNVIDALEVMDIEEDQPNVMFGMPTHPAEWDPPEEIPTAYSGEALDGWTTDARVAVEGGAAYFPPTDPPIDISDDPGGIEVAAGFQSTAMDDNEDWQEDDSEIQDGEIVDNVVRELNEDATTTQLNIHVASVHGTVFLTGYVSDPTDGDAAAAVAERVDSVRYVVERLVVGERPVTVRRPRLPHAGRHKPGQVAMPGAAWRATVARNEKWLRTERQKVQEQIDTRHAELASYGRSQDQEGTVSNHQGDIGSDVAASEVLNSEIASLQDEIDGIDEALEMIEDGRYGICVTCGQLIDPARLRANPLAIRDLQHQQEFEVG